VQLDENGYQPTALGARLQCGSCGLVYDVEGISLGFQSTYNACMGRKEKGSMNCQRVEGRHDMSSKQLYVARVATVAQRVWQLSHCKGGNQNYVPPCKDASWY
jgi:hypothetical protein